MDLDLNSKRVHIEGMHQPSSFQDQPGPGSKGEAHRAEEASP